MKLLFICERYAEQRAHGESEGEYMGFGLTEGHKSLPLYYLKNYPIFTSKKPIVVKHVVRPKK